MAEIRTAWGRQIRRVRRDKELTAAGVAREVGVSRQYFCAIEAGLYAPSDDVRIRIAKALGVEPGDLFNYDLTERAS